MLWYNSPVSFDTQALSASGRGVWAMRESTVYHTSKVKLFHNLKGARDGYFYVGVQVSYDPCVSYPNFIYRSIMIDETILDS
jgi:hypothetical protein